MDESDYAQCKAVWRRKDSDHSIHSGDIKHWKEYSMMLQSTGRLNVSKANFEAIVSSDDCKFLMEILINEQERIRLTTRVRLPSVLAAKIPA